MQNLTDIAVFVQVVDSGSFTAAAERLELTRSVISKYVSRLEDRLKVRLLNRTTRRLSLTEAGQIFYERSQHGLGEIEAAEAEVAKLQATPRGRLKINSPMSFGILHIAPAMAEFQMQNPDVQLDMNLDDRQIDLVEQGYDVAIRIAELPDSSLVATRLAPCHHVVCASSDYIERYGEPCTPDDLRRHNILSYRYQDSPNEWRFLSPDGRYSSVPVTGSIEMNNSLALRQAVLGGAGIMLTPTFIVGEDIAAGRLLKLLPEYRAKEVAIYAVYAGRRHLTPKVRAFIDYMKKRLSDPPYWDKGT
ncbi:MAG: LysR family transcriptional regulator [gamma proteobacterium endosymbiont of Lamellibrachia anaximandri]|nr:LysR family transcriptional regulator [gamma proteobacterium endosymbiont of Lamellibrachia anaximandri]MBL3535500.1 LysR family transcriptional regulator [gamma proteobacterium endosymbiont of Lamellibrachia anaximandri]